MSKLKTNTKQAGESEDMGAQHTSETPTSRLIVKNIPKHLDELRLKLHFTQKGGTVTDVKIMRKGQRSRLFGFVGFKTEEEASQAKKYFDKTYIDTSKIQVEYALAQNDPKLARPWSKYSKGSSAYMMKYGKEDDSKNKKMMTDEEKEAMQAEIERKKEKFRSFLKVMGMSKETKQSWNDSFTAFMADDGSGLVHTSTDQKKKRKAKEEEKEKKKEEKEAKTNIEPQDETEEKKVEDDSNIDEQRLYVMNLPFQITHDELRELFSKYGEVQEIEIPLRKGGQGFGFAFVRFATIEATVSAYAELDKTFYQGRKLHILPAQKKPPPPPQEQKDFNVVDNNQDDQEMKNEDGTMDNNEEKDDKKKERIKEKKSTFKEEKEKEIKSNFDDETNWNYLFMNQDAVAASMASKLNISKGSLLDRNQANLAVRVAKAETIIINQTKEWLKENGIDLDKLENTDRLKCKRSHTVILVKNIPYSTKESELKEIFERYGVLKRLLLSPFNTLAIVEYENEKQAKAAMQKLAYYKINYIMPIYLEYAPVLIAKNAIKKELQEEPKEDQEIKQEDDSDKKGERTVFVKNLNFSTVEEMLEQVFKDANVGKILSCKIVRNSENQLSRGYGFVELESKEAAEKAIKKLQNFILEEHALKLSISKKDLAKSEKKKKQEKLLKKRKENSELAKVEAEEEVQSNKLLIKNLAFEATEKDIKELFKTYGALKKVRLPKKINSTTHRGFGFAEFVSSEEAKNAFKNLQHTHLYGRKIIIEWAKPDDQNFADNEKQQQKRQKTK